MANKLAGTIKVEDFIVIRLQKAFQGRHKTKLHWNMAKWLIGELREARRKEGVSTSTLSSVAFKTEDCQATI